MSNLNSDHRASYDDEGNIILPQRKQTPPLQPVEPPRERAVVRAPIEKYIPPVHAREIMKNAEWIIIEENPTELHAVEEPKPEIRKNAPGKTVEIFSVRDRIVGLRMLTRGAVREGARQYTVSINAGAPLLRKAQRDTDNMLRSIWNFLAQPVWVPTRKKQVKQYSRGTLFLLDIVRFGGTFSLIFLGLFVALNYDSFWQIAQSKLDIVLSSPTVEDTDSGIDNAMVDSLKASASQSQDGRDRGELLSFLPTVGPPDNRVLIPKLHLNVPLITPPLDSLMRQDWTQVETDIQAGLAEGVVHYPGTAKPGQAGNFFITGHSSYYPWAPGKYKTVFARLQDLKPGDEYWVYYKGDRHRYIVTEKKEVSPSDVTVLDQPENKRISTLMTCTPVGTTLRRLIIVAQEVNPVTGEPMQVGERGDKGVSPKVKLDALPI